MPWPEPPTELEMGNSVSSASTSCVAISGFLILLIVGTTTRRSGFIANALLRIPRRQTKKLHFNIDKTIVKSDKLSSV